MTRRPALIVALFVALAACGDPETAAQWSKVQTEFDQAVDELGELGNEVGGLLALQASRLGETMNERLGELDGHMGRITLAMEGASISAQERLGEALAEVEARRTLLEQRLGELGDASGAAADELRQGVVAAYEDLLASMEDAQEAWRDAAPPESTAPVSGEVR